MAPNRRKRKREACMHPQNKYAESPPDFAALASMYPTFSHYVFYTRSGEAKIDWTDFNATRELTRILLWHDFGVQWWIPDGQLCPTIPNRANYIHWIQDLLSGCPSPWHSAENETWGLDIGTGSNCIYPLLGASIHGWHFVGTDVTDMAFQWAQWNVDQNSHLSGLIFIRNVNEVNCVVDSGLNQDIAVKIEENGNGENMEGLTIEPNESILDTAVFGDNNTHVGKSYNTSSFEISNVFHSEERSLLECNIETVQPDILKKDVEPAEVATNAEVLHGNIDLKGELEDTHSLPVLYGVVHKQERFDFCMCNPPFFESMDEAGANPRTACGGTPAEMVYPGGEEGFITKIIEDSSQLKDQIHWFTTMVGRKVNLKRLISKLRIKGVTMLQTTEFSQGFTARWGLAWSFSKSDECLLSETTINVKAKHVSFTLEGIPQRFRVYEVLQALGLNTQKFGVSYELDAVAFLIKGAFQGKMEMQLPDVDEEITSRSAKDPHFVLHVFEQTPGTLLVKGNLVKESDRYAGTFYSMLTFIEKILKEQFCVK